MGYNLPTVSRRDERYDSIPPLPPLSPSPTILSAQRKAALKANATAATNAPEAIPSDAPVGPLPEYRMSFSSSFSSGAGCLLLLVTQPLVGPTRSILGAFRQHPLIQKLLQPTI